MVLLDADVAACVTTWRSDHRLDRSRQQLLRKLVANLDGTLLLTDREEIAYYGRLWQLATLIASATDESHQAP